MNSSIVVDLYTRVNFFNVQPFLAIVVPKKTGATKLHQNVI